MFYFKLNIICIFFLSLAVSGFAQEALKTSAKSQLNTWTTVNFGNDLKYQFGARFIPEISFEKKYEKLSFDAQVAFNTAGALNYKNLEQTSDYEKFSPYRIWTRLSGKRFEVRLGLQKINFGSAAMLRPLMWFDRMDARDPLQLTDGVYALLGRYYFKNNANIWLWTLYGNNTTKGWEAIPSTKHKAEWGGRFQFPVFNGEAALSFHNRTADVKAFFPDTISLTTDEFVQNKYGIDGKWDIGIGLWFEYVVKENRISAHPRPYKYEHAANIGIDYTFALGNGLNTSAEFFYLSQSDKFFESDVNVQMSALSLNYPIGLFDRISAMVYYNRKDQAWYRFVNYQLTFDYWSFYFMAFWNPKQFGLYNMNEQNLFSGKGIQIMAVYNF